MKPSDRGVPKALRDIWVWKEVIYQEVRHMPVNEALSAILDRASETASRPRPSRRQHRR